MRASAPPIASLLLLVVALGACSRHGTDMPLSRTAIASFVTTTRTVSTATLRVADTPQERARGLMGVSVLPADEGMVFVFDAPTTATFWMKDTLIPLSIAFLADGRVVDILEMSPCSQDPCPTYASSAPYTQAVEMNAGWFHGHGVRIGDPVDVSIRTR